MTNAEAIAQFDTNLKNSLDMGDRRWSVQHLASQIGAEAANQAAKERGLLSSYYHAA